MNSFYKEKFVENYPEIFFTRAEGNVTIVLNRNNYTRKMKEILLDSNIYEIIKKDSTKQLIRNLGFLLTNWKNKNISITLFMSTFLCTFCSDGVFLRRLSIDYRKSTKGDTYS